MLLARLPTRPKMRNMGMSAFCMHEAYSNTWIAVGPEYLCSELTGERRNPTGAKTFTRCGLS